jgi:YggT family protein
MQTPLIFIVDTVSRLYIAMFVLRFIFQWVRGSYHTAFGQIVLRVTAPLVVPVRRLLPSVRGVDVATLVIAIALEAAATLVLYAIATIPFRVDWLLGSIVLRLASLTLGIYCLAILLYVLLSWIVQGYHPVFNSLGTLIDPLLRPARRIIPPVAGLDLTPMIVTILLYALILALPRFPFV